MMVETRTYKGTRPVMEKMRDGKLPTDETNCFKKAKGLGILNLFWLFDECRYSESFRCREDNGFKDGVCRVWNIEML